MLHPGFTTLTMVSAQAIVHRASEPLSHVPDDLPPQMLVQTSHADSVFRFVAELGKIIHETLSIVLSPAHPPTGLKILQNYTKYLTWYDSLPDYFRLGHSSTPAVLFIQ